MNNKIKIESEKGNIRKLNTKEFTYIEIQDNDYELLSEEEIDNYINQNNL